MSLTRIKTNMTKINFVTASSDYTLKEYDGHVDVDSSGGTISVTMPSVSGLSGERYTIRKKSSDFNKITVSPDGTDTIDGGSSIVLPVEGDCITLVCDESNTDWVLEDKSFRSKQNSWTPTFSSGFGTVSSADCYWTRMPNGMFVSGSFVTDGSGFLTALVSVPGGFSINSDMPSLFLAGRASFDDSLTGEQFVIANPGSTNFGFSSTGPADPDAYILGNYFGGSATVNFNAFLPLNDF